jgi:hypothetical protein
MKYIFIIYIFDVLGVNALLNKVSQTYYSFDPKQIGCLIFSQQNKYFFLVYPKKQYNARNTPTLMYLGLSIRMHAYSLTLNVFIKRLGKPYRN